MIETIEKNIINNNAELNKFIGDKTEVEFKNIIFKYDFVPKDLKLTKIIFNHVEFKGSVFFRDCKKIDSLIFNKVVFHHQLAILDSKIREKFRIIDSQFKKDLHLVNVCFGEFFFENLKINEGLSILNVCCFSLTKFRKIVAKEFDLFSFDSKLGINISELYIENNADITVKTKKSLSITNSNFNRNLSLSVNAQEIFLSKFIVNNVLSIAHTQTNYLRVHCLNIHGTSFINNISIKNANREAYRFIKNELLKLNNKIDSLKYYKLEMEAYQLELKKEKWWDENRIILCLNKISNKHGLCWRRGVLFTLFFGALFFIPNLFFLKNSYWEFGWTNIIDFWEVSGITIELFMKSLYAAHSFDYLGEYNPKGITFVFDFIGRIFITYGYFQTVSAFRKFSKK